MIVHKIHDKIFHDVYYYSSIIGYIWIFFLAPNLTIKWQVKKKNGKFSIPNNLCSFWQSANPPVIPTIFVLFARAHSVAQAYLCVSQGSRSQNSKGYLKLIQRAGAEGGLAQLGTVESHWNFSFYNLWTFKIWIFKKNLEILIMKSSFELKKIYNKNFENVIRRHPPKTSPNISNVSELEN